jgi:hypothetical protein
MMLRFCCCIYLLQFAEICFVLMLPNGNYSFPFGGGIGATAQSMVDCS